MIKRLIISFALVTGLYGFSSQASATHYGQWLCTNCDLGSYAGLVDGHPLSLPSVDQVMVFVLAVVNVPVAGWLPNDTVTVCDRSTCVTVRFAGSPTALWTFLFARPDGGPPYVNGDGNSIAIAYGGSWWEGFGGFGYGWYNWDHLLYAFGSPGAGGTVTPGNITPVSVSPILSGAYINLGGGGCPIQGCPYLQ